VFREEKFSTSGCRVSQLKNNKQTQCLSYIPLQIQIQCIYTAVFTLIHMMSAKAEALSGVSHAI